DQYKRFQICDFLMRSGINHPQTKENYGYTFLLHGLYYPRAPPEQVLKKYLYDGISRAAPFHAFMDTTKPGRIMLTTYLLRTLFLFLPACGTISAQPQLYAFTNKLLDLPKPPSYITLSPSVKPLEPRAAPLEVKEGARGYVIEPQVYLNIPLLQKRIYYKD